MTWNEALSYETQALKCYESGDFKNAELSFQNAFTAYKKAYDEAWKFSNLILPGMPK